MRFELIVDGTRHDVELEMGKLVTVNIGGESFQAMVERTEEGMWVVLGGNKYKINIEESQVSVDGKKHGVEVRNFRRGRASWSHAEKAVDKTDAKTSVDKITRSEGMIYPPMPGRIISIKVKEGDAVSVGTPLLVLEAMKMQNEISSPVEGKVVEVKSSEGSLVDVSDMLILIQ